MISKSKRDMLNVARNGSKYYDNVDVQGLLDERR